MTLRQRIAAGIAALAIGTGGFLVGASGQDDTPDTAREIIETAAELGDLAQAWLDANPIATTTTVAPTTTTGPTTTTAPPAAGWPNAANTGPTGTLTVVAGPVIVRAGEVLENFDITGTVKFEGNAVIRNGRIRGGLYALSHTRSTVPGRATIENVELDGAGGSSGIAPYGSWTARRLDVHGYKDGIKVGSDQRLEASWVHDLWKVEGSHNDGVQSVGGTNVQIVGNNIEGPFRASTSALILGNMTNYTIERNRLSGGSYTIYVGGNADGPVPRNIVVRENVFVRDSWLYGARSFRLGWPGSDPGAVWSGNTFDDGSPFPL